MKEIPLLAKHLKTGNIYEVIDLVTNATNAQDGQPMVMYRAKDSDNVFVRDLKEFCEKFSELSVVTFEAVIKARFKRLDVDTSFDKEVKKKVVTSC